MKTLFIDTHYKDLIIKLFDDNKCIREESLIGERQNSQHLVPMIKKVCDGIEYDAILVVNGPGSFTGVRLGVTVAKTLAYTLNKEIRTITSLDLMAFSDLSKENTCYSLSDGNGYFIGRYEDTKCKECFYLNNSEYQNFKSNNVVKENIELNYQQIINISLTKEPINPHAVKPIYIKLIGVECDKKM